MTTTFVLLYPPLTSLSLSLFLASSGSSKQESSPNDGIKRVREMTEKKTKKVADSFLLPDTHRISAPVQ